MPLPQSLEVPKSTILFQSKAFKIGSVVQGEFAGRQLLEMAERRVSAVTYATVVGVASTALQPSDREIVPSAGDVTDTRMTC